MPAEDERKRLRNQFRGLGFLCERHSFTFLAEELRRSRALTARALFEQPPSAVRRRKRFRFLDWLITGKLVCTRKGEPMEFLSFEDETGLMECTLFSRRYSRHYHLRTAGGSFLLSGYQGEDFAVRSFMIEHLVPLRLPPSAKGPPSQTSGYLE